MWRGKKLIIVAALAAVLLAGGIGGVVAAADNGEEGTPHAAQDDLLARVAAKIGVDEEALAQAFAEAKEELRTEALEAKLQALVDEGKLTQDQADELSEWWQGKPDFLPELGAGGPGGFPGHRQGKRFGGFGGHLGDHSFGGFGGWGKMAPPAE